MYVSFTAVNFPPRNLLSFLRSLSAGVDVRVSDVAVLITVSRRMQSVTLRAPVVVNYTLTHRLTKNYITVESEYKCFILKLIWNLLFTCSSAITSFKCEYNSFKLSHSNSFNRQKKSTYLLDR